MEMARNMRTATAPADSFAPARHAAPAQFQRRETQISSFSFGKRVAALSFAAQVFGVKPGARIPPVEVHYELPAGSPIAEELGNEKNPQEAFKEKGPVAWAHRGVVHFNGWQLPRTEEGRAANLVHEMAHILFAVQLGMNAEAVRDKGAYITAAEGVAIYAQVARVRSSGMEWNGLPEWAGIEYQVGYEFFNSIREAVGSAKAAFHLIASSLPASLQEIVEPQRYLARCPEEWRRETSLTDIINGIYSGIYSSQRP
jgi:hypothetical protein